MLALPYHPPTNHLPTKANSPYRQMLKTAYNRLWPEGCIFSWPNNAPNKNEREYVLEYCRYIKCTIFQHFLYTVNDGLTICVTWETMCFWISNAAQLSILPISRLEWISILTWIFFSCVLLIQLTSIVFLNFNDLSK